MFVCEFLLLSIAQSCSDTNLNSYELLKYASRAEKQTTFLYIMITLKRYTHPSHIYTKRKNGSLLKGKTEMNKTKDYSCTSQSLKTF